MIGSMCLEIVWLIIGWFINNNVNKLRNNSGITQ